MLPANRTWQGGTDGHIHFPREILPGICGEPGCYAYQPGMCGPECYCGGGHLWIEHIPAAQMIDISRDPDSFRRHMMDLGNPLREDAPFVKVFRP